MQRQPSWAGWLTLRRAAPDLPEVVTVHGPRPVPEGHLRIARRFNAGFADPPHDESPAGTAERLVHTFLGRPYGTQKRIIDLTNPRHKCLGYSRVVPRGLGRTAGYSVNGYYIRNRSRHRNGPHTPRTVFSAAKHAREKSFLAWCVTKYLVLQGRDPVNGYGSAYRRFPSPLSGAWYSRCSETQGSASLHPGL